jgi:Putative Flp pilus-assembly TadE/G-like
MKTNRWNKGSRSKESGQAMVLVVLALALFLLGAAAFAVDMGNLWFRRQSAQNAADAACMAGAMDMLVAATGASTGRQGFTTGAAFDCQGSSAAVPCKYAAFNGYDGVTGNNVFVSFPGTVAGVPNVAVPDPTLVPNAFMRVDVLDHVQTYFAGFLSGNRTQDVRAFAVCGTVQATSPIPLVVLHPTQASSLQGNGSQGEIKILGGPTKSIEVNSGSSTAVAFGGRIDLSQGGPNYSGSQLGTFGGPATPTGTFLPGPTYWISHSAPIADPFQAIPAPTCTAACPPATPSDLAGNANCTSAKIQGQKCVVDYWKKVGGIGTAHGCPYVGNQCILYTAGYYPAGIAISGSQKAVIFDPGVYYLGGPLTVDSNATVRPSTFTPPSPNNIGGTVFYVTGSPTNCGAGGSKGLICFSANSGTHPSGLDTFDITAAKCPGGGAIDAQLLATLASNGTPYTGLSGNLLLAPCTGTYGDPTGAGQFRGMLFFQDRASNADSAYGGGGSSLAAGSLYFHQTSGFGAHLQLQGNSGSTSFILGEIVVDTLGMGGTPEIDMVLNPSKTNSILKATLLPWSDTSN